MNKKGFHPEKYRMIICARCHGNGYINDYAGRNACLKCGGFGFVKKVDGSEENGSKTWTFNPG